MQQSTPAARTLVLVGGGHSHALFLRMLGMNPLPGVRAVLISNVTETPYSGMLPGFIAGYYSYDEAHIDLRRLAEFAGVEYIPGEVEGIDAENRLVNIQGRPAIPFDVLSLNVGSTPAVGEITGVREFAVPVKPVPGFLNAWNKLLQEFEAGEIPSPIIVGGGAGGVELALCFRKRLGAEANITLLQRGEGLLNGHGRKVRQLASTALEEGNICLEYGATVSSVLEGRVVCEDGREFTGSHIFWVTHASPAPFLRLSGLELDRYGFVLVGPTLQSLSHPHVFAAGDIATMKDTPRPKSGVFAVRQAKPLNRNLRAYLRGQRIQPYKPQSEFLSLIGTGMGEAIASRGEFGMRSRLLWKLKDWIDKRFMLKFENLTAMDPLAKTSARPKSSTEEVRELVRQASMRCSGCAAKLGPSVLRRALAKLQEEEAGAVVKLHEKNEAPDDAALIVWESGKVLAQTIDYLPLILSDNFLSGQICAHHCLSDLFAMGADPKCVQVLAMVPFAQEQITVNRLVELLAGLCSVLKSHNISLVGGHSAEGNEMAMGLVVNGAVDQDSVMRKTALREGDKLILTKPLGTGTLFAAQMRLKAKGRWIDAALSSMLMSNGPASEVIHRFGASGCTDITGFGLCGHLHEMIVSTGLNAHINVENLPLLEGASETVEAAIFSSLHSANRTVESAISVSSELKKTARYQLLFDPQTSGGLLAGVAPDRAEACLAELHQAGCHQASIIGEVRPGEQKTEVVSVS